jgi:hypothetical protein
MRTVYSSVKLWPGVEEQYMEGLTAFSIQLSIPPKS